MTKLVLKHVQRFKDRHGRLRHYYRRPGHARVALPGDPGSAEFMAAYQAAHETPLSAGEKKTKPGSVSALIVAYYQSTDWAGLKPVTQHVYRLQLDRFRKEYGDLPANGLQRRHAHKIMDKGANTPGATRNLIKRLRTVWAFGVEREMVFTNPFQGLKLPKEGDGFRPWSDADIAQYEAYWPEGSRERLALALLLYTTQRRSDVVKMGRQHRRVMQFGVAGEVREVEVLHVVQKKHQKGKPQTELAIPIHPDLRAILDSLPASNMTYLITKYGSSFAAASFTNWFVETAQAAGLPKGSGPHGLRKAGSRRLAEAGCTPHEIQSISGHKSLKEVERYTKSAAQARLADAAMSKLDGR